MRIRTENGLIEGVVEESSANGIVFTATELPAVRSRIEFTVTVPEEVMDTTEDVATDCIGSVVRHQHNGDRAQAKAMIDEYTLRV